MRTIEKQNNLFTWCEIEAEIVQKKNDWVTTKSPNKFLIFQIYVQQNIMINWNWTSNWQLSIRTPICYKLNSHDCFSFGRRSFDSLSFSFSLSCSFSPSNSLLYLSFYSVYLSYSHRRRQSLKVRSLWMHTVLQHRLHTSILY